MSATKYDDWITACIDHAGSQGFTQTSRWSYRLHGDGPLELRVMDYQTELRLVIRERRESRYGESDYTVETGSIDLNNIAPEMFAAILETVMSRTEDGQ
ncbi:MAG: hypothetical protein WA317_01510 [Mycobacterium sp.]|uniref:hypothetical protein n=1 Tax=Mycobacterium sp. TaxID=1785 RepID=UPI003CC53EF1